MMRRLLSPQIDKAFNAIFVEQRRYDASSRQWRRHHFVARLGVAVRSRGRPRAVRAVSGSGRDRLLTPPDHAAPPDGESIDTGGSPSFAFGVETAPEYDRFNPLNLVEGRWPSGSQQVAIDERVADEESLAVGDRVGVAALGPAREFEIVGVARYGDLSSLGSATFAIFDVPTAQALLDKRGELDAVQTVRAVPCRAR